MGMGISDNRCNECPNIRGIYDEKVGGGIGLNYLRKSASLCHDTWYN
jgi:hypothetical protein